MKLIQPPYVSRHYGDYHRWTVTLNWYRAQSAALVMFAIGKDIDITDELAKIERHAMRIKRAAISMGLLK